MEQPFPARAEQIAAIAPSVAAATSDADDEVLRRRPEPGRCALEVVGYLVDKLEIWRARAQAIASQKRPHLDLNDQDALVQARSYRTGQLSDLLEELAAGCAAFVGTVRTLGEERAGRTGIHPEHGQLTLPQCVPIPLASVGPHLTQLWHGNLGSLCDTLWSSGIVNREEADHGRQAGCTGAPSLR